MRLIVSQLKTVFVLLSGLSTRRSETPTSGSTWWRRFPRWAHTRPAALVLSQRTASMIRNDTDVSGRITASGDLARAHLAHVARRSTGALSKGAQYRGRHSVRTISSRTTDLVEFVASYGGAPLPPETLHTFARLCELNLYDEDKFPCTNFGEALARIGGVHALAVVARMADREKASLGLSLPPLLTLLVKHRRLGPEFAVGLIGLDSPVGTWSWSLVDFAGTAIPEMAPPASRSVRCVS